MEKITPNYEMAEQGILGLSRLLGLATWVLTLLAYFLTDINSWTISSWLTVGFLIWLAAGKITSVWLANTIQFLTMTLILGTPIVFDVANQDSWIPITVIALNMVGVLSFQIKNWLAFPAIITLLVAIKVLIDLDLDSYLYGGAKFESGLVSISYLAVVGIVAWSLRRITLNQALLFDEAISVKTQELENINKIQIEREINQSIARRLHESILNTLNSITRMRDLSLLQEAKVIVERDLAALAVAGTQIKPMPLVELIEEALDRAGLTGFNVSINPGCDGEIPITAFTPLLESILEVLRNAERHSNAKSISIHWNCNPSHIELVIKDDGCGFDITDEKKQGYGQKVISHRELKKLGHSIEINSEIGKGTEVVWQLKKVNSIATSLEATEEWPSLTQENFAFRLLFLAIPLFIVALLPLLTAGFANQFLTVLNFIGYVTLLTFCAINTNRKYQFGALPFLIASIFWGQFNLIDQTSNCVAALPIQWIINGYTVGILLVMTINFHNLFKVAIVISNFLLLSPVARSFGKCQEVVVLPGLTGVVLSVGIIIGLNRLRKNNLIAISEHARVAEKYTDYQIRQNSYDRAYLRLQALTKDAQILLRALLDGDKNLDLAELKEQSRIQESYLRSALIIIESMSLDTQQGMLEMLSRLARNKVVVSVETLTDNLENLVWPPSLIEFGNEFSNEFNDGTCKLFFYEENSEIILVIEANGEIKESFNRFDFVENFTNTRIRCSINLGPVKHSLEQIEQLLQRSSEQQ
jgi:signal transduction histidine kinase